MHEGGALTWRDVVDKHHSGLVDELSALFDSELKDAASRAVVAERAQARSQALSQIETLNHVLRRLRRADEREILPLLAEGCAPYAEQLVVLVFESNQASPSGTQARSAAGAGLAGDPICFDTAVAPAITAAIESHDPFVALMTEGEISPALAAAFGIDPHAPTPPRAYLFPVVARHTVVAMLVASAGAVSAQIGLLCEAAGMRLETVEQPLHSTDANPAGNGFRTLSWDRLSADDQKLHLQAQRTARLRVAEMRLYHENDLKSGTAQGDIYGSLQEPIDTARRQFLENFLAKSASMVDYLHLEILRSLARDDDSLLGHNYPGPMV